MTKFLTLPDEFAVASINSDKAMTSSLDVGDIAGAFFYPGVKGGTPRTILHNADGTTDELAYRPGTEAKALHRQLMTIIGDIGGNPLLELSGTDGWGRDYVTNVNQGLIQGFYYSGWKQKPAHACLTVFTKGLHPLETCETAARQTVMATMMNRSGLLKAEFDSQSDGKATEKKIVIDKACLRGLSEDYALTLWLEDASAPRAIRIDLAYETHRFELTQRLCNQLIPQLDDLRGSRIEGAIDPLAAFYARPGAVHRISSIGERLHVEFKGRRAPHQDDKGASFTIPGGAETAARHLIKMFG